MKFIKAIIGQYWRRIFMTIVQEAFDIPLDINVKLAIGEYKRIGGIVRQAVGPNKGQIVKHLKPIDLKEAEQNMLAGKQMIQFAKKNKKALIVVGAVAGAIAVGNGVYHMVNNRESMEVKQFRMSLKEYIFAIREGKMDISFINKLKMSLENLKKHRDYEKIVVNLSSKEVDILINRIYEYTINLANKNNVDLLDKEQIVSDNTIINLENILNTQRQIWEMTA